MTENFASTTSVLLKVKSIFEFKFADSSLVYNSYCRPKIKETKIILRNIYYIINVTTVPVGLHQV